MKNKTFSARHIAVVGAGMAGIACARTLAQAGHDVTVFEQEATPGGRMATRVTPFGTFDHGTQYFTVRDARFTRALETVPGLCKPWSANAVRVLDPLGRVAEAALPGHESHWVAVPGMDALVTAWAAPLAADGRLRLQSRVTRVEPDRLAPGRWQLQTEGPDSTRHVHAGFETVLLALPAAPAAALLKASKQLPAVVRQLAGVDVAPCWTLMIAFPNAAQPGLTTLGPQWNAARSTHHRVAWLARESSKPRRDLVERWTVQASAAWSHEHAGDTPERVQAKLLKAFSEITGIRATPAHAEVYRWNDARTLTPLGRSHLWNAAKGLGLCGDWCTGHRTEDAFLSGLELALAVA
jgi:hypothetical protein